MHVGQPLGHLQRGVVHVQLGEDRSLALRGLQRPHQVVELSLEDDAGREASEPLLLHLDAAEAESVVEGPDVLAEDVSLEVVLKPELQEDRRGGTEA